MDKFPVPPLRRHRYELAIKVVDLVVYLGGFLGGLALWVGPLTGAAEQLGNFPLLIALWSLFLMGGGGIGFIGRLTGYWLVEVPAAVAAAAGALIYVVVLVPRVFENVFVALTLAFAVATLGFMVRRWLELQIFGSEPGDWRARWAQALHRRTRAAVERAE